MNLKNKYIYPLIFSIYPVIALTAYNINELDIRDTWRSLIFSTLAGMATWLLLQIFLRNWGKSAAITSMILGVIYAYGHIYIAIKKTYFFGDFLIGRHRFLLPTIFGLLTVGIIRTLKKHPAVNLNETLNWIAFFLLAWPTFQIISYETAVLFDEPISQTAEISLDGDTLSDQEKPDIYYIILDAYGRADILKNLYGYDNEPFLNELRELGFYVAECSQSNYPQTKVSLAASLNMDYEQDLWRGGNYQKKAFDTLITHSRVRQILEEEEGYITVAFLSGHRWSEITDASVYLSFDDVDISKLNQNTTFNTINNFEIQLIETTIFVALSDLELLSRQLNVRSTGYLRHRERVLFSLETLVEVPNIDGPKFVFAHIVAPHRPFVFSPTGEEIIGPDGEITVEEDYATGYINQVSFLNMRVIPVVKSIIEQSETPPVIIIQGDHGPSGTEPSERAAILNAYYLPNGGNETLYPSISPVNTFRAVLNYYFGYTLDILDDYHFRSTPKDSPSEYPLVPNTGSLCTDG